MLQPLSLNIRVNFVVEEFARIVQSQSTGSVELRSGGWRWSASRTPEGYMVAFRHALLARDEMKTWVAADEAESIIEVARHPVYRVWEDPDHLLWIVALDFASLRPDSPIWLTFRNALSEKAAMLPATTALGELTSAELAQHLREAS